MTARLLSGGGRGKVNLGLLLHVTGIILTQEHAIMWIAFSLCYKIDGVEGGRS